MATYRTHNYDWVFFSPPLQQGFDHLQSLVINTSAYPSGKVSKAVILEKSMYYLFYAHLSLLMPLLVLCIM